MPTMGSDQEELECALQATDPRILSEALHVIAKLGGEKGSWCLPDVVNGIGHSHIGVKVAALTALGHLGSGHESCERYTRMAQRLVGSPDNDVRRAAVDALGRLQPDDPQYTSQFSQLLADGDDEVRAAAATALGNLGAIDHAEAVARLLKDPEKKVVVAALGAISRWGEPAADLSSGVADCLVHASSEVRAVAVGCLLRLGDDSGMFAAKVLPLLRDECNATREAAVSYFEVVGIGAKQCAEEVAGLLDDEDSRFRAAGALVLGMIKAETYASRLEPRLKDVEEDAVSYALAATGAEARLPVVLRRPCCAAMTSLALLGDAGAVYAGAVADDLGSDNVPDEIQACKIRTLGLMGAKGSRYRPLIRDLLDSVVSPAIRAETAFALGEFAHASSVCQDSQTATMLAELCGDPIAAVREAAVKAIGRLGEIGPTKADVVFDLFRDRVGSVQVAALETMASFGELGQCYAAEICKLIESDDIDVRLTAIEILGNMGERGAAFIEELEELLEDPSPYVQEEALRALAKFGVDWAEEELQGRATNA